jgi:cytochrome P450
MVFLDGDAHQQAQSILLAPLAQMVKKTPASIRSQVGAILADAQRTRQLDLVKDFASPVSRMVIAQVLGIPTDDHETLIQIERWSDTFTDFTSGYLRGDIKDVQRLVDYFRALIEEKRRAPGDDLISALIAAPTLFPEDDDLISNCIMIFSAGHVTSRKMFGNGIPVLMQQWDAWRQASRADEGLPRRIGEELLRMITPTRYLIRQASEDIDLSAQFPGNHQIRQGQRVFLFLEAANYDPAEFPHPAHFDPHRGSNKHIAFGYGPHRCPGAALGRLELQIAIEMLLERVDLRPKPGAEPAWDPNPNLGGYASYAALVGS